MIFRTIALVGALVMSSQVAAAQDFTVKKAIGRWTVYRYSSDCWMRTSLANGTNIAFSTAQKNDDLYIQLQNRGWESVSDDGTYDVRVQFGPVDRVKTAYGSTAKSTLPPGVAFFLDGTGDAYIATLKGSAKIRITMEGKELADTTLGDAGQAFDYLRACTLSMKSDGGDPFSSQAPRNDPFKK